MSEWCFNVFLWKGLIKAKAWPVGLIGLLSPLLCAGLWSWEIYEPAEKEYTEPFQKPSEQVHQAVLCTACFEVCHTPNIPTLLYSTNYTFQLWQESWVTALPLVALGEAKMPSSMV